MIVFGRNNSTWAMFSEVQGKALRGVGRRFLLTAGSSAPLDDDPMV